MDEMTPVPAERNNAPGLGQGDGHNSSNVGKLLLSQLKKCQLTPMTPPATTEQWQSFLTLVGRTYQNQIEAHYLLERSLAVTSKEMYSLYENLKQESEHRIEALHKSEQKNRFMANMSHELRTPIHGILGSLEVLRTTPLDERQRLFTDTAYTSCEVMLDLVNNVLDYSKIRVGQLALETVEFSPRELVESVSQILATIAHKKELEVQCFIPDDIPEKVSGDATRIRQILMNLGGNAVKFTEKGEVLISLEIADISDYDVTLRFEVRDTGIGIPKEMHEHIFESFVQVDPSISRRYGGTGLGLSIVKELTTLMGGKTWLESAPGQGSHFWVELTLPMVEPIERSIDNHFLDGRYILVIDDNETNQFILKNYLKSWRAKPIIASTGMEALQMLRNSVALNEPFSAILLDWFMPEMDGITLARSIRTDRHYDKLPIIMLTSSHLEKSEQRELGVNTSITKPIRASILKDLLIQQIRLQANSLPGAIQEKETEQSTPAILLAEDNPINALIATTMLEELPYRIDHVETGKLAFKAASHTAYHLILMDINMPDMDGYMAAEAIRAWEQSNNLPPTPIIALTANALKGDRDKCLKAGMNDYLTKPVKKDEMLQAVKHWLEQSPQNPNHKGNKANNDLALPITKKFEHF